MPKFDLDSTAGEVVKPEYFEHPQEGWLSYDPNTLHISPNKDGQKPVSHPIALTGKFWGTKQAGISTCSEPREGNRGCSKWSGCKIGQRFPHVGPGTVIMKFRGTVSSANCYDYFESTRGGRPTSQSHYGMDGWTLDTTRTTIDVLGRTAAIDKGKLNVESTRQAVVGSKPQVWQMEIGGLLPPWWPMMKKKGLPLPESAKHYPELAEDDENENKSPKATAKRRRHDKS